MSQTPIEQPTTPPAIEIVDVHKRFGALHVLRGLTLQVKKGEVYGLLGQNGAGKSTLTHLLLGFLQPDSGRIAVMGSAPRAATKIGYLPERVRYHASFTAREYMRSLGAFSGLREPHLSVRVDELLDQVGLWMAGNRRLGRFSKGMLQRLGLAQAIIHSPELLLIDEPSSGLDLAGQRDMVELLADLRAQGLAILMCSHQVAELETLCDRVGVLRQGRIVAEARVQDVLATTGVLITVAEPLPPLAISELSVLSRSIDINEQTVVVTHDERLQRQVFYKLLGYGARIVGVRPAGGLTEFFMRATRGPEQDQPVRSTAAKKPYSENIA
ncbi:MAG: ABC transporter ATP-binding protein [Chloroflexi bacterium]|nr:ABC transporter ATP-binding protein [Chloroflexota bacterium]